MTIFKKPQLTPGPVQNIRTRFQSIRDDAVTARDAFERIANTANSMIVDATKGAKFAEKWITDADQIIQELGGQPVALEEQIRAYAPKSAAEVTPE